MSGDRRLDVELLNFILETDVASRQRTPHEVSTILQRCVDSYGGSLHPADVASARIFFSDSYYHRAWPAMSICASVAGTSLFHRWRGAPYRSPVRGALVLAGATVFGASAGLLAWANHFARFRDTLHDSEGLKVALKTYPKFSFQSLAHDPEFALRLGKRRATWTKRLPDPEAIQQLSALDSADAMLEMYGQVEEVRARLRRSWHRPEEYYIGAALGGLSGVAFFGWRPRLRGRWSILSIVGRGIAGAAVGAATAKWWLLGEGRDTLRWIVERRFERGPFASGDAPRLRPR